MIVQDRSISEPNPYELLDLPIDSRMEDINNEAYKRALLKRGAKYVHQINDAFTKLRDPVKRMKVDAFFYEKEQVSRMKMLTVSAAADILAQTTYIDPTSGLMELKSYDEINKIK